MEHTFQCDINIIQRINMTLNLWSKPWSYVKKLLLNELLITASSSVGLPFTLNFVELCIVLLLPMIYLITFQDLDMSVL